MSIYDALHAIKKFVDECENLIRDGKLAVSLEDVNVALRFVEQAKSISIQIKPILEDTKQSLDAYKNEDALFKYISAYYRTAVLVSVPYVVMILKNVAGVLEKNGYLEKAKEARNVAENIEVIVNTLRSRRERQ
ncbi:MAG: hypothetical protein QW123_00955 [Desulfurococcaceae archaeon]|jgi:hypothetical protein